MLCTVVTVLGTRAWESLWGVFCGDDSDGGALSTVTSDEDVPTLLSDQVHIGSGAGPD